MPVHFQLSPAAQIVMDGWWNDTRSNQEGIAGVLREVINQLQQSSATHPAFISCPDLLDLCEELEQL